MPGGRPHDGTAPISIVVAPPCEGRPPVVQTRQRMLLHTLALARVAAATAATSPPAVILLDPATATVRFDGIGGDSGGGGGSRLLLDYEDSARSDVLDLLFTPKFGSFSRRARVQSAAAFLPL